MRMDPNVRAWLDKLKIQTPETWPAPDFSMVAQAARTTFNRAVSTLEEAAPGIGQTRELEVQGAQGPLPARLYSPANAPNLTPGMVFFHGGGFVVCDLDSHDALCRRLCAQSGVRILSVAYRLAPEHKFPAAVEDAVAAFDWARANAFTLGMFADKIAVGGDSAGGNLSAVVTQEAKRAGRLGPAAQLLIYPLTQLVALTPSQLKIKEGYLLTQAGQDFFKRQYLVSPDQAHDVRVSPLLEDNLSGLPPAFIVTAGHDPLQDEGRAYGDKLSACGVGVEHRHYGDQVHGFWQMTRFSSAARSSITEAGEWLARTLLV